jgi:membrane-associated HD superfamily phosphohydrolase
MSSTIYPYSFIPSLILMIIGVVVLLAWVFGTNMYDKIEKHFDDDDFNFFVIIHIICSIISVGIWLWFKDSEFLWPAACIFNTWLSFLIAVTSLVYIARILSCVRKYCLTKRGKK